MTTMTTTITPSSIRLTEAEANFPDGHITIREMESIEHAKEVTAVIRDGEWHTVSVAMGWSDRACGLVFWPDGVPVMPEGVEALNGERDPDDDWDYDRIALVEDAIATLERAKAVLLAQQGAMA